jgi:protein-disulfide isomerase
MVTLGRWVALGLVVLAAGCGGGGEKTAAAPAAVSDDALKEAVVGYFQRAVTQPGLEIEVTEMAESPIPGLRKGKLAATLSGEKKELGFYVTADGRWLIQGEATDLGADPMAEVMEKISLDGQPSRGPADAKVTIVEYSDYQCPFCARAWETLEKEVLPAYGDRVRFVFKNLPLKEIHPWAEGAALASECALRQGNDHFWTIYNGFFTQQKDITPSNVADKAVAMAEGTGMDAAALRACIEKQEALDAVQADLAEATEIGVTSTPTFIINGKRVSGAQTFESFKAILDQQLGAAG